MLSFEPGARTLSRVNAYYLARASAAAYSNDPVQTDPELELPAGTALLDSGGTFGFLADSGLAAILAFRGTAAIADWLTDGKIRQIRQAPYPGLVHQGFAAAMDRVWPAVQAAVASGAGRPLWITGHSLGAALATLTACRLAAGGVAVQGVYTFGSPRVGNIGFYLGYTPTTFRFISDDDVVTHVPLEDLFVGLDYFGYKHVGTVEYLDRHGHLGGGMSDWETKKQFLLDLLPRRGAVPQQAIEDHRIDNYISAINTNL
jgi:hypothetical protein